MWEITELGNEQNLEMFEDKDIESLCFRGSLIHLEEIVSRNLSDMTQSKVRHIFF